jgi:hypothetical protein
VIQSNATYSAVVGGIWNTIQAGANQSAIGGGYLNTMQSNASYSTIGGGIANTLQTNAFSSTIGGGYGNTIGANAYATTISGGEYNGGSGRDATVGGGFANFCGADRAAVGGGVVNSAYGYAATVPGGYQNEADGQYSFAAGQNARASHDGSFVWSDESSFTTFASTGINEFDIRAYGGVHFVTGGAGVTFDGQTVATTNALTNLNAASITSGTLPDVRLSTNVALRSGGNAFTGQQVVTDGSVGVGTGSPQAPLHVRGGYGSQLVLQDNVLGHSWSINNDANDNLVFVPNTGTGGYIYRGNGNYFSLSDLRLKQDVRPLGGVLERVLQLRPVSYRFRSAPEGTPLTLGFIAQEVEPLFPEVVGERAGMKTLAYSELIPVTVGALQELNRKVDSENAALRAENAELKRRLEVLEEIVCNQK